MRAGRRVKGARHLEIAEKEHGGSRGEAGDDELGGVVGPVGDVEEDVEPHGDRSEGDEGAESDEA